MWFATVEVEHISWDIKVSYNMGLLHGLENTDLSFFAIRFINFCISHLDSS